MWKPLYEDNAVVTYTRGNTDHHSDAAPIAPGQENPTDNIEHPLRRVKIFLKPFYVIYRYIGNEKRNTLKSYMELPRGVHTTGNPLTVEYPRRKHSYQLGACSFY